MAKKQNLNNQLNDWEVDDRTSGGNDSPDYGAGNYYNRGGAQSPMYTQGQSVQGGYNQMLPPIVQPIAFVPYTTQDQALLQMVPSNELGGETAAEEQYYYEEEPKSARKQKVASRNEILSEVADDRGVKFIPIFSAILSLLVIAVVIVGKFVLQTELALLDGTSGFGYIENLIDIFTAGGSLEIDALIIPGAVALVALFAFVNLVISLITMKKRGASVVSKICVFFLILFSLALILIGVMDKMDIGYGMYAVAGLSFVIMLFSYLAKKD